MLSFVQAYVNYKWQRFIEILLAPILMHFGHISWVIDLAIIIGNSTITQGMLFMAILVVIASFCSKNSDAAIFRRKVFKYLGTTYNNLPSLISSNSVFASIKSSFLALKHYIKNMK